MSRFARRVRRRRRNSLRRPRFDYTSAGGYFVTMNTWKRLKVFGNIERGRMIPSALGRVVWDCWRAIPDHFDHVRLGAMVVMPDHVHATIHIVDSRGPDLAREVASVGATHASPLLDVASRVGEVASREVARVGATRASPLLDGGRGAPGGSLGAVVGAWKAASARLVNLARGTPGAPLWHRGYHDRIIRDEWALRCITRYIIRNPERWERDRRRPKP